MGTWNVQAPDGIAEAEEARALLSRGLSLLGLDVGADAKAQQGKVAIFNCGSGEGQSWAWRRSPDRAEIYADSRRAAAWAVHDFLECSGLPLPPRDEAAAYAPVLDKASERRKAVMERRVAVYAHEALAQDLERAEARAFSGTLDQRNQFDLGRDDSRWEALLADPSPGFEEALLAPGDRTDPAAFLRACLDRASALDEKHPGIGIAVLWPGEEALALVAAARDLNGLPEGRSLRGLGLVLDDGDRCRGHALSDPACPRNAPYALDAMAGIVAAWKALSGAAPSLRLRYGDEGLFGFQPPLLPGLAHADARYAVDAGFGGIQLRMPSYHHERPDANAWAVSRACFGLPAEMGEFVRLSYPGSAGTVVEETLKSYYRDQEAAWKLALHRATREGADQGIPRARSPLDPRGEDESFQRSAAESYDRIFAYLDCAKEALEAITAEAPHAARVEAERAALAVDEAVLEYSGALRALYSRIMSEDGISRDIYLIAEETWRRLVAAIKRAGRGPALADARGALEPPLAEAARLLPAGPVGKLMAALRRAARRPEIPG